jgi:hypothetical protein
MGVVPKSIQPIVYRHYYWVNCSNPIYYFNLKLCGYNEITMNQQEFKIWFAGFYEGEGSVSNDKSNNNRIRLSVSQNDRTPLDKALKIWGGVITKRVRKSPASDKICTGYEWRLCHNKSILFIKDIKKFMIIPYKINQIADVIKKAEEGNDDTYKCKFCEKIYANPAGRRRHEKKEHVEKDLLHKCKLCDKQYKGNDSLKRHIKLNHNDINSNASISKVKANIKNKIKA